MTIDELLENYRNVFCLSEVEKGIYFERLMKNFLLTCPTYRGKFSDVWLWKNFPYRNQLGGKDLGIDIVAKTSSGEFWAIQCKFYSDNSTVEKSAVDSFIANSARSFFADGVEKTFSARLWIATTENYSANAREMFKNQSPEIKILNLENLRHANVNWSLIDNGFFGDGAITKRFLKDYQKVAVEKADEHFQKNSRGQLIMACGSGKTFTSLKIAEKIFPRGKILFLVPSISLLSQTLEEWAAFSENPINAICVCSDSTASSVDDEIIDVNLPLPAMTDSDKISDAMKNFSDENMTVFFSTYQSIDVVSKLNLNFDLVICDEAHRTTGFSKQTNFTKVHEDENISAKKRLYMTATPKLFKTDAKDTDDEKKLSVWSMDDEKIFGKEFFRISFAESVAKNIWSDYKVFVLTVSESDLNPALRKLVYEKKFPLTPEETLKLIGSIQALSKNMDERSELLIEDDKKFMHTAVAFCQSVKKAETVAKSFPEVLEKFIENFPDEEKNSVVKISADFVSGKMSSNERAEKLNRLKNTPTDKNICNVLSNVRCLSEGVDVPALDAIIFLSPKKSEVEIIQAVGRVMRKAAGKKYGYIIIPVVIPADKSPEEILSNSADFGTVWDVLNSLRAHDERMDIFIEKIKLGKSGDEHILIGKTPGDKGDDDESGAATVEKVLQTKLNFD